MNRPFFIKRSFIIALFSVAPIFGMIVEKKLTKKLTLNDLSTYDVHTIILNHLHKKDQNDMRLVCKKWANKGPDWKFMPDNLEKKYDKKRNQRAIFRPIDRTVILFDCAVEQDLDSIQWIKNTLPSDIKGVLLPLNHKCSLYPCMIAVYHRNPEMARLLIESSSHTACWKNSYDTLSVPETIEQCLYTGNNRDFSFLLYLNAAWSDNVNTFKQLYKQNTPTPIGQELLIKQCLEDNAQHCFTFLLKQKNTKNIIRDNPTTYFKIAVHTYRKELPQKLIKKKLFHLNDSIFTPDETILDYYEDIKDSKAIALLLDLGAKRWADLHH